jgi:hypothetical protein
MQSFSLHRVSHCFFSNSKLRLQVLMTCTRLCPAAAAAAPQVLEKLREWQATIKGSQLLGKNPLESFELNFLFTGSPGECC